MSDEAAFDVGRLARALALITAVTAVFALIAARRLEGELLQIGSVAIGTVALITAITCFLIAFASAFDEPLAADD
jgi:hypothetical protein